MVEQVRQKLLQEGQLGGREPLTPEPDPRMLEKPRQQALQLHTQSVAVLVLVPWVVFVVLTCLFALPPPAGAWRIVLYGFVVACAAFACLLIFVHVTLLRAPAYLYLGLLCLLALAMGCAAGDIVFERDTAEFWLHHARPTHSNALPTEPAASFPDASALAFTDAARVDLRRVLGFRPPEERRTYCVAPILGEANVSSVQFWAAGEDCCEPLWGFYCDDALKPAARSGAVLSGAASAYAARRYARFRQAAHQAAALYHLDTPEDPLFVRWLEDPQSLAASGLRDGAVAVLLFCALYLLASLLVAALLHWSGLQERLALAEQLPLPAFGLQRLGGRSA